jgi:uncharacterized protein YigE (DUF2233 family)
MMGISIALISPLYVPCTAADQISWEQVQPDVEHSSASHKGAESGQPFTIEALRIDPRKFNTETLDAYQTITDAGQKYSNFSLRDLADLKKPVAIISGGFTDSFSQPIPSGLIVENGQITARLNRASVTQSGVFCVNTSGVSIIDKAAYTDGECKFALQSGPKLVEPEGKNGITSSRKDQNFRSAMCIDKDSLLLFIYASQVTLADLAEVLRQPSSEGGYECVVALNLSGDIEAGMIYRDHQGMEKVAGHIDALLASAIAIFPVASSP